MLTFIIGLVILFVGGALYGKLCESVFGPDDRETPAYAKQDGVDYVPMKTWKNSLINLLNIAGTGPILGPIQGILFGPIAFLAIPIGNVIGGSMHDYLSGMVCIRDGGTQMPEMVKNYTNKGIYAAYNVFMCLLLLLVGAVFIYTPGDIAASGILGINTDPHTVGIWVVYAVIFAYYLIATVFPIDKIIGRIYPIFGLILIFSAVGIFIALFAKGWTSSLTEVWGDWNGGAVAYGDYFGTHHFIPVFFLTVACGILSGFHSTQTALISRTMESEKSGRMTFYNMMILEGFIAMCWAAGTMALLNTGIVEISAAGGFQLPGVNGAEPTAIAATGVVVALCKQALGSIGGTIAMVGVVVLPITSGDTALRALRLTLADSLHIKQDTNAKRFSLAIPIYVLVALILVWAKFNNNGFMLLWRYFAWSNQMISLFALACIAIYLAKNGKKAFMWIPLIPAAFYAFCTCSFIVHNPAQTAGTELVSWNVSYIIACVFTIVYLCVILMKANKVAKEA